MRRGHWIGVALLLGAVGLFAVLAALVASGATRAADEALLLWLDARATPWLDTAALEITALGGTVVIWVVLLLASALLSVARHRYSTLLLWAAYLGGSAITFAIKAIFDRPRPRLFEWRTAMVDHSSFPSGHAMTAVAVYATLAYVITRLEPTRALRRTTRALAAAVITLIGVSRVYLGVHHPTDVLAGFAVGIAWATTCAMAVDTVRSRRRDRW